MSNSVKKDTRIATACLVVGLLVGFVSAWTVQSVRQDGMAEQKIAHLQSELSEQVFSVDEMRSTVDARMGHVATKVADLQARMQRLDALGEHLTYAAGLEEGEFDFSAPVPSGGPVAMSAKLQSVQSGGLSGLESTVDQLDKLLTDRQDQLDLLGREIQYVEQQRQNHIAGKPVKSGWLSSHYGYRSDPFTGKKAWHNGVDYAGRLGSEIVTVAGGVVTKSTRQGGYGYLVEVSHADGYVTRYAHNKKNLVELGDVVEKGQAIAIMGSTGRSTGPHVHFEVLKNGKSYNPARYLKRAAR